MAARRGGAAAEEEDEAEVVVAGAEPEAEEAPQVKPLGKEDLTAA